MDCQTARLLLECTRPYAAELDETEADALERHLAACPDCSALAQAQRRCDDLLGRAMRQVEVPSDLRGQILVRLDKQRAQWQRRQAGRLLRLTAAAAALVLLAWGGWHWFSGSLPQIQPDKAWQQANVTPTGKAEAETAFRRLNVSTAAPDFNYAWLVFQGLGEVPGYPGHVAPVLIFHHQVQQAVVYVLDTQRFTLPPQAGEYESPTGLRYQLHVLGQDGNPYQDGQRYAYLVLHNGDDLAWLKPLEPTAT